MQAELAANGFCSLVPSAAPIQLAPQQQLHPSLGCVRIHNADLRDKVLLALLGGAALTRMDR